MFINSLKSLIYKAYLSYDRNFPIQRGKFILSRGLTSFLGEIDIKTKEGIRLRILPSSQMDKSFLEKRNQSHERVYNEINQLRSGDVFVDIGANIGYFSFLASYKVGDKGMIFSFEPSRREYTRFLIGQELNAITNIVPLNCALSNENGMVEMEINKFHTGLNKISNSDNENGNKSKVFACKGEMLIHSPIIHLMKIDVEGAEFKVLLGMEKLLKERRIIKLIVEISDEFLNYHGNSRSQLYLYLEKIGYKSMYNSKEGQFDEVFYLS